MKGAIKALEKVRTDYFFEKVVPKDLLEVRTKGAFTEFTVIAPDGEIDVYKIYGSTKEDLLIV